MLHIYDEDTIFNPKGFSFEFMVRPTSLGSNGPLLRNSRNEQYLELGINEYGHLYFDFNENCIVEEVYGSVVSNDCICLAYV